MRESQQAHSQSRRGWSARRRSIVAALLVLVVGLAATQAFAASGPTTLNRQIVEGEEINPNFFDLETGPGSDLQVRDIDVSDPDNNRKKRRDSMAYFAQLTDFQLADEESPARVEFLDQPQVSSAWRPQEAFHPFAIDESIRRVNSLFRSPFKDGDGDRARMKLAVLTGDQADNQQYNETLWVRQLIEPGSKLDPGSGVNARTAEQYAEAGCPFPLDQANAQKDYDREPNYIGVQDYEEFERNEKYYDPEDPAGEFENWPEFNGLMDRAQEPFKTTGLKVPSYVVNGNHDTLVQGNEDASQAIEQIVTGCFKPTAFPDLPSYRGNEESPNAEALLAPAPQGQPVPPDADRRFVSKGEIRNIFADGSQNDDHGFAFVDEDEDADDATRGNAWYYAWNPTNRLRFISIDTVSEGGVVQDSSQGNVDDPQFQWLESELQEATDEGDLVVVFGHHPIRSLNSVTPDEEATVCGGGYNNDDREYDGGDRDPQSGHNHAAHPGCDPDVRNSEPLHGNDDLPSAGETIEDLFLRYPHVVAYVPGHTHENRITPFERESGDPGGFWELNTSAIADWPQQQRVIDLMNNNDCTLSIFSAVSDHASNVGIPGAGNAGGFGRSQLGALGRNFSFNDPQSSRNTNPPSEGTEDDRNVELVLPDPRGDCGETNSQSNEGEGEGSEGDGGEGEGEEEVPAGPTGPTGPLGT